MKNSTYTEYIRPVVVLVVICVIVTTLLAVTYGVANPIIQKNTKAAADAARTELLPGADSFTKYEGELAVLEEGKVYVKEVYTADNGAGMVVTVATSSFGGELTMMVGIDTLGAVTGIKITDHADTPGVGTKNWDKANRNYVYDNRTELITENVKDGEVEFVTGASVTGNALHKGMRCAFKQSEAMGGDQ